MCHSPAFTCWLYLAEDQPPIHRGAAVARSLWIPVDDEPEPETPAERVPGPELAKDTGVPPADRIRLRSID